MSLDLEGLSLDLEGLHFHLLLSLSITLNSKSVVLRCVESHIWRPCGEEVYPARTAGAVLTEGRVANTRTTCVLASIPRQRQKLAQINNSARSQIQFTISHRAHRAIIIKVIDCNQSNQAFRFQGSQSFQIYFVQYQFL